MRYSLAFVLLTALFFSCGGDAGTTTDSAATEEEPKKEAVENTTTSAPPAAEEAASDKEIVTIELAGNDQMQYDQLFLQVDAGTRIRLTLTHSGQMAKAVMGHNFVLLKEGTSMSGFVREALKEVDNDYIPQNTEDIIAHTKMLGGGESDTIEFDAPPPGTYDYICTFPGHFAVMKGKLVVS